MPETVEELEENNLAAATNELRTDALIRQIEGYRNEWRHLNMHYEGSLLWDALPSPIDVTTWSNYWMLLADFANTYSDRDMYVHGVVVLPVDVTREIRMIVYMLLIHNTPFAFFDLVETVFLEG